MYGQEICFQQANLLISSTVHLKIADFGLARICSRNKGEDPNGAHLQLESQYSHQVATRWYRSPKLLHGAKKYDEGGLMGCGLHFWLVISLLHTVE